MRHVLAALLALGLAAGEAQADELRELGTATDIWGWEAVGRIDMKNDDRTGFCTGTLVSSTQVLTAAHCVVGEDGTVADPEDLLFRAGLRRGEARADRRIRRIAVHPDYRAGQELAMSMVASDLALLELERPLDAYTIPPLRTGRLPERGERVQVVSYAKGRSQTPSHERSCSVLDRASRVLALDCQATFGASGSPVFVSTSRGLRIVSVISATGAVDDRPVTFAVTLEDDMDVLRAAFPSPVRRTTFAGPGAKTLRPTGGAGSGAGGSIRFLRPGE